jgi:hypothetical protein
VRIPTGADGPYLLHVYIDESIPGEVRRFCSEDDKLTGEFHTTSGGVAFGGLESAFRNFRENRAIRSAAGIAPGTYTYTAYRTEYPDEVVSADVDSDLSRADRRYLAIPGAAILISVIAVGLALATRRLLVAGIVVALCAVVIELLFAVRGTKR